MDIWFSPVELTNIEHQVARHWATMTGRIDSWFEDHLKVARHYAIRIDGSEAGFTSIHDGATIVQFALSEPFRRFGQPVYQQARRLGTVQSALVPTCDEFFLSHALDDVRHVAMQAYFFTAFSEHGGLGTRGSYSLQPASMSDIGFVREHAASFFDPVEDHLEAGRIFITSHGDQPSGFGFIQTSWLYPRVASIGMFTIERFRQTGVGTATISLLIDECRKRGVTPVAGCWYYNHGSKRTLERAGMYSPTRVLRVDY